jgi:hypothetical protein
LRRIAIAETDTPKVVASGTKYLLLYDSKAASFLARRRVKLDFRDTEINRNFKMANYSSGLWLVRKLRWRNMLLRNFRLRSIGMKLMNSIKKGNIQSVKLVVKRNERKRFVDASPQFKTAKIYNFAM